MSVVQSCPLIQELEIMGPSYGNEDLMVDIRELSLIALCTQLKRLTLSNLRVINGNFLEEVIVICSSFFSNSFSILKVNFFYKLDFIELYEIGKSSTETTWSSFS